MATTGALEIVVRTKNDVNYAQLLGELDLADSDEVIRVLTGLVGSTVVVDLSGLIFLDAAGVNALLAVKHKIEIGGQQIRFSGATGIVRRLFDVSGLQYLLENGD
jgi:anti-anti-sigma factor